MASKQVMREDFATFLKVDGSYKIMGEGITDMGVSYNPKTSEVHYIHEKNARTSLTGFALSSEVEQEAYFGDPIYDYLDELRMELKTGSDIATTILLVNIYDEASGSYKAQEFDCKVIVGEIGGAGGETLKISYTVSIEGSPTQGNATISNGVATFVADTPSF